MSYRLYLNINTKYTPLKFIGNSLNLNRNISQNLENVTIYKTAFSAK